MHYARYTRIIHSRQCCNLNNTNARFTCYPSSDDGIVFNARQTHRRVYNSYAAPTPSIDPPATALRIRAPPPMSQYLTILAAIVYLAASSFNHRVTPVNIDLDPRVACSVRSLAACLRGRIANTTVSHTMCCNVKSSTDVIPTKAWTQIMRLTKNKNKRTKHYTCNLHMCFLCAFVTAFAVISFYCSIICVYFMTMSVVVLPFRQ